MTLKRMLIKIRADKEMISWVGDRTLEQAWTECERGDWMLWFAHKVGVPLKHLVPAISKIFQGIPYLARDDEGYPRRRPFDRWTGEKVLDEATEEMWESWPPAHMWIVWNFLYASTSKAQADIVREYIPIDILIARKKVSIIKIIFCGRYKLTRTDLLFHRLQLQKQPDRRPVR